VLSQVNAKNDPTHP